jgi:hypothetical protein
LGRSGQGCPKTRRGGRSPQTFGAFAPPGDLRRGLRAVVQLPTTKGSGCLRRPLRSVRRFGKRSRDSPQEGTNTEVNEAATNTSRERPRAGGRGDCAKWHWSRRRPHFRLQRPPRTEPIVHRATEEQAQTECEWKRGKRCSLRAFVCASVTTLTLTRKTFSWKPFERERGRICSSPGRSTADEFEVPESPTPILRKQAFAQSAGIGHSV